MQDKKLTNGCDFESMTDETLFNRFKGGDQRAFEVLLARYQGRLFSMIYKSVNNRAAAEDMFQDVFFKIIERRDQFRDAVSFKAWAYTICRNTCIDGSRKRKRTPKEDSIFVDEEKPLEIRLESRGISQYDATSGAEHEKFVADALKGVPGEQRETFYYKVRGELTFEEIGAVMQCSVNTAKSRMRYVLGHLREVLTKRGYLK